MVQAALAMEIAGNLTQSGGMEQKAQRAWEQAMRLAKSLDAMERPTVFPPQGRWVTSRRTLSRNSLSDRG